MVLGNQHKDIVNVDFHLTNKLHFKNDIVIDDFLITIGIRPQLLIQVKIVALVVLHIARGEQFIARKIVKRGKDIPQPQDCAKQRDKVLLVLLTHNGLTQRELCLQLGNQVFIAVVVFAVLVIAIVIGVIILQQNDTTRIAVTKQGNGFVGFLLQIAEADNIAVCLYRVQNTVRARERLYQAVHDKVLIHPERI